MVPIDNCVVNEIAEKTLKEFISVANKEIKRHRKSQNPGDGK